MKFKIGDWVEWTYGNKTASVVSGAVIIEIAPHQDKKYLLAIGKWKYWTHEEGALRQIRDDKLRQILD